MAYFTQEQIDKAKEIDEDKKVYFDAILFAK